MNYLDSVDFATVLPQKRALSVVANQCVTGRVAKAAMVGFTAMIVLATGSATAGPAGHSPFESPAKPQLLVVTETHPAVIDVSSYPDAHHARRPARPSPSSCR